MRNQITKESERELVLRVMVADLAGPRLHPDRVGRLASVASLASLEIERRELTPERVTELKAEVGAEALNEIEGIKIRTGIETTGAWFFRV